MKTTAGCVAAATANRARTIFSPSPIHFEVKLDALMLKNVEFDCDAMHFPINVFPVPGGPNCFECIMKIRLKFFECIFPRLKREKKNAKMTENLLTSKTPLGGCLSPVKISGRRIGRTTASLSIFLAYSKPAMLSQSESHYQNI